MQLNCSAALGLHTSCTDSVAFLAKHMLVLTFIFCCKLFYFLSQTI